ncbi:hypothetical protein [Corynebacterium flavescens]|uniref:hypothetical protein n=1 Tax=Corynebacterium flavescens TaxID=28028 RepID=UPI00289F1A8D|nr:hypothetical protein [Corynebacterium flavescens]
MNDELLERFSRALVMLENLGPRLDDLLFPRQALVDGERVSGSQPKSKPPLVVPIMDLKVDAERCLQFWVNQLAALPIPPGISDAPLGKHRPGTGIGARAGWLRERLVLLACAPWAEQAALEVIDVAWLVAETVEPAGRGEPVVPPTWGTARVIASWLKLLGAPLSRTQLQRLVEAGELEVSAQPDGSLHIAFDDALALARKRSDQANRNLGHVVI